MVQVLQLYSTCCVLIIYILLLVKFIKVAAVLIYIGRMSLKLVYDYQLDECHLSYVFIASNHIWLDGLF